MKKILLFILSVFTLSAYSQKLEWTQTIIPNAPNYRYARSFYNGLTNSNNDYIVYTMSSGFAKSHKLMQGNIEITDALHDEQNPFFTVFDKQGNFVKSQLINLSSPEKIAGTPEYNRISVYSRSLTYNEATSKNYLPIIANHDSISFGSNSPWFSFGNFANRTFIAVYDDNFDYLEHHTFTASNNDINKTMNISDINFDTDGNMYFIIQFSDSLFFDGNFLAYTDEYSSGAFVKLNSDFQPQWVNVSSFYIDFGNISYSAHDKMIYAQHSSSENRLYNIHYNDKDTTWKSSESNGSLYIFSIDPANGHIVNTIDIQLTINMFFSYGYIMKESKDVIILSALVANSDNQKEVEIKIANETYNYDIEGVNNYAFIYVFNKSDFSLKHINFFSNMTGDNGGLHFTNVYSDTLYSVLGASFGNINFGFDGNDAFAEDYLQVRTADNKATDFLATYSINNKLKDLWFFSDKNNIQVESFFGKNIESFDKDIYIVTTIDQYARLGLGTDETSMKPGLSSKTIIKYSCMPTAYFEALDHEVNFKNLSSGFCDYLWDFGDGTTSQEKNPKHSFKSGIHTVRLYVTNNCGTDSFERKISISNISVKQIENDLSLEIHPNPVQDKLYIDIDNTNSDFSTPKFIVRDMLGKEIICPAIQNKNDSYEIETNHLSNGVYILTISNQNSSKSIKFVVSK